MSPMSADVQKGNRFQPQRNARIAKQTGQRKPLPDKAGSSGSHTEDTESTEVEPVGRRCAGTVASVVGGGIDPAVPRGMWNHEGDR